MESANWVSFPLPESLALMSLMERNTACAMDISRWENRLAEGHGKFSDMTSGSRVFPPLFIWIVAAEGDDPGKGFARAAEIYRERAVYRSELLLQAALPAMVLLLGLMVMAQVLPWMGALQSRIAEFLTGLKMN